jgi:nucleoside-diphosphate-sugar epimerase
VARVFITGEKGFIARNLRLAYEEHGHTVVSDDHLDNVQRIHTGEVCVHRNSELVWENIFKSYEIDLVVHNAAVVGTDVVALNPVEASSTNTVGTYNICRAAEKVNADVCYMGTSVIYDTPKYQDRKILEDSDRGPRTLYGALKLAGEHIVKTHCKRWTIMRPLFAYGGVGDMNSLIAKTFFAAKHDKNNIDMFLDPALWKDYIHVSDFCDAVVMGSTNEQAVNEDFNVSAQTPRSVGEIVEIMSGMLGSDISSRIKWHPNTDYLGNHRLSSKKFRTLFGWSPTLSLEDGISLAFKEISESRDTSYNPLKYLEDANEKNIDLTQFYN